MRRTIGLVAAVLAACLASACGMYGFGPGRSMYDHAYFSEKPHIVARPGGYSIRWRYGTWGFFFTPESKVVDGELLFALRGTSSSGTLTGRYGEETITDPKRIRALETRGSYWLEPDGRKIRLEVVKENPAP